ncbi:MAG: outer membrane beta-barrel protein [Ignavibacteriales bacterium]|nr:outer membrane beta-barrel protein [Ignavibacteriales bacterium]
MKKLLVISIILFLLSANSSFYAQGKISRSNYKLGGNVTFSSSSSEDDYHKYTALSFDAYPSFSFLITDHLEIGTSISFYYFEDKYEPKNGGGYNQKYFSRNFGIGPMIRYYIQAGSIFPFVGAEFRYATNKLTGDNKEEGRDFSFYTGIDFFLSSSVAVEPIIKYTISNNQFYERNTFSVGVGINYFITK